MIRVQTLTPAAARAAFALRWISVAVIASAFMAAAAMAQNPATEKTPASDPGQKAATESAIPRASGDPKTTYNNHCRTCHAIDPGDNRLGPTLHGVVGRKAGSVDGYSYSPGFKTTDLVWTEENLDKFIANPNAVFPGSNMATFAGLSDAEDRKAIIDYMKTLK